MTVGDFDIYKRVRQAVSPLVLSVSLDPEFVLSMTDDDTKMLGAILKDRARDALGRPREHPRGWFAYSKDGGGDPVP